jgi:uncharacterized membrane protein
MIATEMPEFEHPVEPEVPVNRMAVAVLALFGLIIAGYMLLYKVGVFSTLACGTGSCAAVQASPWAVFLGLPVPLLGVIGYGLTLAVALAGIQPAYSHDRRVAAALFGLSAVAFVFSLYLTAVEAFWIRAWCRWCVGSAIVATLLFVCAFPELRRLRGSAHE